MFGLVNNMSSKTLYYKRKFLNGRNYHAGAFILAKITKDWWISTNRKTKKKTKHIDYSVTLDLADCSRIICLDLDLCETRSSKNSLKKLDILIDTLVAFRKVFVTAMNAPKNKKGEYV